MQKQMRRSEDSYGAWFSRVHTITKKHYIPESTFIYQKAMSKHMQGGVCMPYGLLIYVCWIIKMYTSGKKMYTILKRDINDY